MRKTVVWCVASFLASVSPSFAAKIVLPSIVVDDPPSICDALPGNLVTNCGFETGTLAGWTQSGNMGFTGVDMSNANSGTFGAFMGPVGSHGFLSQTLATISGAPYSFGFYFRSDGGTPNDFSASWDGVPVFTVVNSPSSPYTLHIIPVVGTGSDTIQFSFRNDPAFQGLDDVGVVPGQAVPEPISFTLLGTGLIGAWRSRRKLMGRA